MLHSLEWYNRFPNDWNQIVSEDHEQNCRENFLCILAFALQMLSLRTHNLYVLQGMSSSKFPGFIEPVDVLRKNLFDRKGLLDSTPFCLKTAQRVSPYSPSQRVSQCFHDTDMNLTLSFLSESDQLVINQHLLLAPAITLVKPACSVFAHRPNPSNKGESRCFQQNHKSMSYSVSGTITV